MAGGGTGGHVIPALAIARELRDSHGAEVRFVGTARGLETRLVPEAGFPLELIQVGQLKNVSVATRLRPDEGWRLPSGYLKGWQELRARLEQRREPRRKQRRFRHDPLGYLAQLERRCLQLGLPA